MKVQDYHGKSVIDSREVAEMVEKQHKNLLADIRGYLKIMEKANGLNFQPVDFFIPSTYQDNKGEDRPCYLITKKGCDMIANKLTGEKGVLFTEQQGTDRKTMSLFRQNVTARRARKENRGRRGCPGRTANSIQLGGHSSLEQPPLSARFRI